MPWLPYYYFSAAANPLFHLQREELLGKWIPMLAVAVPFLWVGLALTVQRLRALRRAPLWAILFFVPFFNVAFFLVLVMMAPAAPAPPDDGQAHGPLDRLVPEDRVACVLMAMVASIALAGAGFFVSYGLHMPYGANVFFAVPFLCGYLTRILIGYRHNVSLAGALGWAAASQLLCGLILVVTLMEGTFCVMIALPVVIPIAMLGAAVAHWTEAYTFPSLRGKTLCVAALVPLALGFDAFFSYREPGVRAVVTQVRIVASPAEIWTHIVAFPPIERPDAEQDVFDRFMVPRLASARIEGRGVGAIRHCEFTHGEFVEPILVWKPGQELTFAVTAQPSRLSGSINVRRGQFLFEPQADGSTLLTGTTWYEVSLFPPVYWDRWMSYFLHTTHRRALEHVRDLSERRVY